MRRNGPFAAAIGGAFFVVATAVPALSDTIIQFGSDYFEYVSDPLVSWATAEANAASLSYLGATGYLAVVTSAAENNFLAANYTISTTLFEGAWLGGECNASAACFWETGPLAGQQFSQGQTSVGGAYVNWGGIEPNNSNIGSAVYMNIGGLPVGIGNGQWADAGYGLASPCCDPVQGYIVEFSPTTPLPAALPLFASGLAGLGLLGWRRKRKTQATGAPLGFSAKLG
jgi:hypothetical protein